MRNTIVADSVQETRGMARTRVRFIQSLGIFTFPFREIEMGSFTNKRSHYISDPMTRWNHSSSTCIKGVTTGEITDLLERMYGHHYTPQTISNMTKTMEKQVEAFKARTLAKRYVCVYLDATLIAIKRATVSKEAVYLAIGIQEDGTKEVLAYTIAPTESAGLERGSRRSSASRRRGRVAFCFGWS